MPFPRHPWWREIQGRTGAGALRRAGLAALALVSDLAAAALSQVPARALLEARAFDHLSMIAPPPPPADTPLVVAVDEPTFAELEQRWPWPRDIHARLVGALRGAGAQTIALDIVFAEPTEPAAGRALAAALGPDTVLAADESVIETPQAVQLIRTEPLPMLLAGGAVAGLSTIPLDRDGVARRLPGHADALARVLLEGHGAAPPPTPPRALLQFYGPARSMPTVSYYQELDPAAFLPPSLIAGRDVIVGLSLQAAPTVEEGSADAFPAPATVRGGGLVARAEIHATGAANLLAGDWIRPAGRPSAR